MWIILLTIEITIAPRKYIYGMIAKQQEKQRSIPWPFASLESLQGKGIGIRSLCVSWFFFAILSVIGTGTDQSLFWNDISLILSCLCHEREATRRRPVRIVSRVTFYILFKRKCIYLLSSTECTGEFFCFLFVSPCLPFLFFLFGILIFDDVLFQREYRVFHRVE